MDIIIMNLRVGQVSDCKQLLEEAKEKMGLINSSETIIFSKYYKATLEYRKVRILHLCITSPINVYSHF